MAFLVERHVGPHRPLPRRSPAVGGELDQEDPESRVGGQRDVQGAVGSRSGAQPVAQHRPGSSAEGSARGDPSGVAPGGAGGHAGAVHHRDVDSAFL